jgi:phosphatidylglycerol:prolipoprotein diacylglycerol transferase
VRPELFRFFDIGLPAYFTLLITGMFFATGLGVLWARRVGENPDVIVDLGIAMLLSGVAGSRLLHVLADGYFWDYVHMCTDPAKVDWPLTKAECVSATYGGRWDDIRAVCHPIQTDCFAWAKFWAGGLTYYGGFLGAFAAAWFLLKRDRFPFWRATDMSGFATALGLSFGRMG